MLFTGWKLVGIWPTTKHGKMSKLWPANWGLDSSVSFFFFFQVIIFLKD